MENKSMEDIAPKIGFVISFIAFIVAGYLLVTTKNEKERLERDIEYINATYLHKQGGTSLYNGKMFSYDLRSFDAGKTWYACENKSDSLIILGNAETIYPGLVKFVNAWHIITEHARQHGPLKVDEDSLHQIMEDAHIKIVKNGK